MRNNRFIVIQKYWRCASGNQSRLDNALYTIKRNLDMVGYMRDRGIDVDYKIYDFSPIQELPNESYVEFRPYPLGVYKRSEKINLILEDIKHYDHYMLLDCDILWDVDDYDALYKAFKHQSCDMVQVWDVGLINEVDTQRAIDGESVVWKSVYDTFMLTGYDSPLDARIGYMGGQYMASTDLIIRNGGYDESFTTWGDEDLNIYYRIDKDPKSTFVLNRDIWCYHLNHFRDLDNGLYIDETQRKKHHGY